MQHKVISDVCVLTEVNNHTKCTYVSEYHVNLIRVRHYSTACGRIYTTENQVLVQWKNCVCMHSPYCLVDLYYQYLDLYYQYYQLLPILPIYRSTQPACCCPASPQWVTQCQRGTLAASMSLQHRQTLCLWPQS
jgi:hypothetical protein